MPSGAGAAVSGCYRPTDEARRAETATSYGRGGLKTLSCIAKAQYGEPGAIHFGPAPSTKLRRPTLASNVGRPVAELAQEIKRQAEAKRDFLVPSDLIVPWVAGDAGARTPMFKITTGAGEQDFTVLEQAHRQIAHKLDIPRNYLSKLVEEAPDLWVQNVQHWLMEAEAKPRLMRTLDGQLRAFMSERYRPLDNVHVAEYLLRHLSEIGAEIVSAEITDLRLYVKAIDPKLKGFIKPGTHDFKRPLEGEFWWGMVISNSEVGAGTLQVQTMNLHAVCSNTAIMGTIARNRHVGAKLGMGDGYEVYQDDTREASDRALMLQLRDTLAEHMTEKSMQAFIEKATAAADRELKPSQAVELSKRAQKAWGLSEQEGKSMLDFLMDGGEFSQWGVANAVTALSGVTPDYDRATELEAIGGKVIELPQHAWREVAA